MNPSHEAQRTHFYLILFLPIVCLFTWVAHRCISLFTDFVPFTCLFISQHLFFLFAFSSLSPVLGRWLAMSLSLICMLPSLRCYLFLTFKGFY